VCGELILDEIKEGRFKNMAKTEPRDEIKKVVVAQMTKRITRATDLVNMSKYLISALGGFQLLGNLNICKLRNFSFQIISFF